MQKHTQSVHKAEELTIQMHVLSGPNTAIRPKRERTENPNDSTDNVINQEQLHKIPDNQPQKSFELKSPQLH